jgi:hypothetical protein
MHAGATLLEESPRQQLREVCTLVLSSEAATCCVAWAANFVKPLLNVLLLLREMGPTFIKIPV